MTPEDATVFNPREEFSLIERRLPHWDQPGTFAFVTFRLGDSLPAKCIAQFNSDRVGLLQQAGVDPKAGDLTAEISKLPIRQASILRWKLFTAWDDHLDQLHGASHLRRSDASKIVADGLLKFDRERYVMAAFVVMPNHVHLLAAFAERGGITTQGAAWRKYFAREINKLVGSTGHLWQDDQFDHLVRSDASFDRIRRYIIDKPSKAKLSGGEYRLYVSADW